MVSHILVLFSKKKKKVTLAKYRQSYRLLGLTSSAKAWHLMLSFFLFNNTCYKYAHFKAVSVWAESIQFYTGWFGLLAGNLAASSLPLPRAMAAAAAPVIVVATMMGASAWAKSKAPRRLSGTLLASKDFDLLGWLDGCLFAWLSWWLACERRKGSSYIMPSEFEDLTNLTVCMYGWMDGCLCVSECRPLASWQSLQNIISNAYI